MDAERMSRKLRHLLFSSVAALALCLCGRAAALDVDPAVASAVEGIRASSLLDHVNALVACGTRRSDQPGGKAAQEYIEDFFAGLGLDDVFVQDFDGGSDNVVGILHGATRPERIHVIGAHHDSVGNEGPEGPAPGADDNASGTAAVLEAARAIAGSGVRPAETIAFALFSGEENGMTGSQAFVDGFLESGETFVDMICLDVIGYVKPGTLPDLSVTSSSFPPQIFALIEYLGEVAAAYLPAWSFEGGEGCG